MSKEETIKNLKKLKSFHNGSYGTSIDEAIKALEQTRWIPMSEQYKNKQSNCNKMTFPQPYKAESEDKE